MKKSNVVDFHTYRALKHKPYEYGGVLPTYVADTLRERLQYVKAKHGTLLTSVEAWEAEYKQMTQELEHCLRTYDLLPKTGPFTIDDALIDEDGHIFWHESEGGDH